MLNPAPEQAQDELRQSQQNAHLASNQRAALETQLKQAQDKLQQAQQNADLASNQRAALEARLKKAEENLQLAQKRADLAATQRTAAAAKENEEPAKELRAGRTLPPDAPQNPEAGRASNQPLIQLVQSANSLRDNGKPEQKAIAREETGALPEPNEVLAEPALATADSAPSPGVQQLTPTGKFSLTQSQEKARKRRQMELARSSASLYPSVPTPPPRNPPGDQRTEAETSAPPAPVEVPAPSKSANQARKGETDVARDLRRFAVDYLRADEKDNVSDLERFYAGSVHFHGEGDLSWAGIAAATRRYHQNAHQRRYIISQSASVRGPVDGGFWVVEQPFGWTKPDGARAQTGGSVLRMRVIASGHGNFKITSIEGVPR